MLAIRNNSVVENSYLDAARACILDIGVRRTTITEIARRAGVARMTIYRSWPDMTAILGDLMVREWLEQASLVREATTGSSPEDVAKAVVQIVSSIRENELFRKIIDVDPEFMLPYVFQRRGRTQDFLLSYLVPGIAAAQESGDLRAGEPDVIARALLLTAHGYVMSMHTMADTVTAEQLDAELHLTIERYLTP